MVLQTVRIGSQEDIHQYDDGDYDSGIESSSPIKAGAPVAGDDVLRMDDIGADVGDVFGPGASTDHAVARWDGAGGYTLQNSSLIVLDDGSLGIGTSPSYHIHSLFADATAATAYGAVLNHSFSGNHPGGGDFAQYGFFIRADSTVIGTQVAGNRHTLNGLYIESRINASGQSYRNFGLDCRAYHLHTTALTDQRSLSFSSQNSSTATVVSLYGIYGLSVNSAAGVITAAYGYRGNVNNTGAGSIGTAYGVYSQVLQSAGTLTTGFLFYGVYSGTIGTAWGIYLTGCTINFIDGRLGVNMSAPAAQVHIDQSDGGGAIPVLSLDQADTSDGFINFIGSDRGVIGEGTDSVESVRVELNGTVRRLALYADA